MSALIDMLKEIIGYTETPNKCKSCASFQEDPSTDNFGPGDLCVRNQDLEFIVRSDAVCNKWSKK